MVSLWCEELCHKERERKAEKDFGSDEMELSLTHPFKEYSFESIHWSHLARSLLGFIESLIFVQ